MRRGLVILVGLLLTLLICGAAFAEDQDWAAIEAAAKEEGQVVIYSLSSRIFKLVDEFKEKYGIDIIAYDLPSNVQLERFRREHAAGRYTVDVLFNRDIPLLQNEFLPQGLVQNFVPDSVADLLDDNEKEPFLIQRWSSRVLFYNTALNPDGAPIDSLWDLTRAEWKGRVLSLDPLSDSTDANAFQTIMQHSDEMAAAYLVEFGEEISFSDDVAELADELGLEADASMEWLYRLFENDVTFLGSTTTTFKNIADVSQENAPVGLTTFSKLRTNEEGVYAAQPILDLAPVAAITSPTALVIADGAPHPNAAMLLIKYMMEDGFWPWNEPGDYAARSDVVAQQAADYGLPALEDLSKWIIDPDYVYNSKYEFLNLFLELQ